jgi:hypothetical protein
VGNYAESLTLSVVLPSFFCVLLALSETLPATSGPTILKSILRTLDSLESKLQLGSHGFQWLEDLSVSSSEDSFPTDLF